MNKLLYTLLLFPTLLNAQSVSAALLSDNAGNTSANYTLSMKRLELVSKNSSDDFGNTASQTARYVFADGTTTKYKMAIGVSGTFSGIKDNLVPNLYVGVNRTHKWGTKTPYSFNLNGTYAPVDDISKFIRADVAHARIEADADVYMRQKVWLRNNFQAGKFTDGNNRISNTSNIRYYGKNLIFGTQLFHQQFSKDMNGTRQIGYWSPEKYQSATGEVGYRMRKGDNMSVQVIGNAGYQSINSTDNGPIFGAQAEARVSKLSLWASYNSNNSMNGEQNYRWSYVGARINF